MCICSAELACAAGARDVEPRYPGPNRFPAPEGRRDRGEKIMRRVAPACIALAMAVTPSPVAAQQTTTDQAAATQEPPPPPPAFEVPPPMEGTSTDLPPPFPRYPARAPREH